MSDYRTRLLAELCKREKTTDSSAMRTLLEHMTDILIFDVEDDDCDTEVRAGLLVELQDMVDAVEGLRKTIRAIPYNEGT